ncbi:hypothetical protein F2Q68_00012950 [Brassica cretica]|uniref:Glycosyltransferase n=1 Tax=Brassica cretica TaxID=69181 RepID=A0A8S9H804_BRACR|nr:hypothetical protein F2Q68_00012950 [Brassica cretica]
MIHGSHVIVLPFPVQGHLTPMFQFCKRLASKGLTSTLVLVSDKPSPPYKTENDSITVFPIPSGSQEGKDPLEDLDDYIDRVYTSIKNHLPELIQDMKLLENPPRALVYDSTLPWLLDVAHDHGLRGAAFFTQPWLVSVVYYHVHKGSFSVPSTKHGHSTLASFPALPMLSANDLPSYVCESSSYPKILRIVIEQLSNIDRVDILLCNTFDNLEEKREKKTFLSSVSPPPPNLQNPSITAALLLIPVTGISPAPVATPALLFSSLSLNPLVLLSSSLCGASGFSREYSESNRGLHACVVFLEHLREVEFIKELKEPSIFGLCFSIGADLAGLVLKVSSELLFSSWSKGGAKAHRSEDLCFLGHETSTIACFCLLLSVIALVFKELHSPSVLHFPSSKLQQILFCLLDVSAASFVSPSRMGSCIDRMRVTVTCAFHFQRRLLRFSVWFSAELAWARLLASSSSCGAPERELAASIDACLSHFGECLTEPGSSYSLDGLVNLNCYEALGMEV